MVEKKNKWLYILIPGVILFFILVIILPLAFFIFDGFKYGNVALIPIEGIITTTGENSLSGSSISSSDIVSFIKEAEADANIKAIVLELNTPGGTPVATDEIATAIKKAEKPVIALIREVGASSGYWIASSTDYIVANRMSITGSIGVFSSYLEFSGLMEKYGVGYERLVAGDQKDIGVPYRKLTTKEKETIQKRLDKLHTFFIKEVAANRKISESKVKELATGDVFLGVEALELGLIDQLGNLETVEEYLKEKYNLEKVDYVTYKNEVGFFEALTGFTSHFSFSMGEGLGSALTKQDNNLILI